MTDKEKLDNLVAEIENRISRNKRNKVFENVPEKKHQLIIEGQLLGELKHFIDFMPEEPVSEELEKAAEEWDESLYRSDAFKAGANWLFERVNEALLSEVLPCFMHGGEADEVVAKLDEVLNQKK